jgi:hypothetical protein
VGRLGDNRRDLALLVPVASLGHLGWGIGLAFNAWDVYVRRPITEDEIRHEMQRLQARH